MNETRAAAGALLRGEIAAGPHLIVEAGPDAGAVLPLRPEQTLGRGSGADLRLSDPSASRLHVRLTCLDGRVVLEDLGSKNGLRVNGAAAANRALEAGDVLHVGRTRLRLAPGLPDDGNDPPTPDPSPAAERPSEGAASPGIPTGNPAAPASLLALALALAALAAALLLT